MTAEYCQMVRIRPNDGVTEERLLEVRPRFTGGFRADYDDFVDARLHRMEDGTYLDLWRWATKDAAEHSLARRELYPGFQEWSQLVEVISFESCEAIQNPDEE